MKLSWTTLYTRRSLASATKNRQQKLTAILGITRFMRHRTPLIVLEGARIDVDGTEVLLIKVPFQPETQAQSDAAVRQLFRLKFPFVLASPLPGGGFVFDGASPWLERVEAKNLSAVQWARLPVYP